MSSASPAATSALAKDDVPTFAEFRGATFRDVGGQYVVNGDEVIADTEAGACFEDNNWRPLTPYDSASIMHYPQCNGSSADLSFTATDGDGVRAIYGG